MQDFHRTRYVTARKSHPCDHCRAPIEIGTNHRKVAQVFDGDFHAYREHIECYEAWRELNFDLRDYPIDEGAPFLSDDYLEREDREWMREKHPLVARRMGLA